MTAFMIVAVLLTAAALLCLLPALLGRAPASASQVQAGGLNLDVLRDQLRELDADLAAATIGVAAYREARAELERRVAQDVLPAPDAVHARPQRLVALALALAMPALAVGLYFEVGNPGALAAPAAVEEGRVHQESQAEIGVMVQTLAERLRREPDDAEGWYVLARSYIAMERIDDAALAYAQVARLEPKDPDVLADYADALASTRGGAFDGEPERLVARALAIDARHPKALALAGGAAFTRGEYTTALRHWETALALVPADSPFAQSTAASIDEARRRLEPDAVAASAAKPGATSATASAVAAAPAGQPAASAAAGEKAGAAAITGTVELDPALRAALRPDDTVFVYARAVEGSAMPLAIVRRKASDLPFAFTLDDSSSMMPSARLSAQSSVLVVARVSRSGSATPAAGDLEGSSGAVSTRARDVKITIGSIRK